MRNRIKTSLVVLVLALSVGADAADRIADPSTDRLVVHFGKPTYVQLHRYKKMFEKQPFSDAILMYYDNGIYKIISSGEEYYGVFVIDGRFDDERYTIHYASLPSTDWSNATAYHVLTFDSSKKHFEQSAVVPIDGRVPQQFGVFETSENMIANPIFVHWENSKHFMPWSVELK
ncbi:hypothetical protein [Inquilinus sp. CA228]|uniref:hypothetical protein n=1 Tax=Inquilinus sp. CA228 TaxID=3455609 RepID=UPI003F8D3D16